METVWVTGGAGFIGSHLVEHLVRLGLRVVRLDSLTEYGGVDRKKSNLQQLRDGSNLQTIIDDIVTTNLNDLPRPATIFHLAGQPGVRPSWGNSFDLYMNRNVLATQRLLEYCLSRDARLVYASSSSVYGVLEEGRLAREGDQVEPHSPYGVTKLAAEHLVRSYSSNYGIPTASLRYFTVYGPRQRPDMAIYRLLDAGLTGSRFPMYGDGTQVREFTYVEDVVRATAMASEAASPVAPVLNIAGGALTTLRELFELADELLPEGIQVDDLPPAAGDVPATRADSTRVAEILGWQPRVALREGLQHQVVWQSKSS